MKINSELPLDLLISHNLELNEYDFVLFHLYKDNEIYREYYRNLRMSHPDRLMILDNSAYEYFIRGEVLDIEEYVKVIEELVPDFYILPDRLMDKKYTVDEVNKFLSKYTFDYSKPMAVAQGETQQEMFDSLYIYTMLGIKAVAIPFHNSFYTGSWDPYAHYVRYMTEGVNLDNPGQFEDVKYTMGRIETMYKFEHILEYFDHVHLLGSHSIKEKMFIDADTIDTGYPVKCGIMGHKLFEEPGKPDIIIDDFVYNKTRHKDLIINNVKMFRDL